MSRDYDREERERNWRRHEQNRETQNRWSGGNQDDEYRRSGSEAEGRNWRNDDDFDRRRSEQWGREGRQGQFGQYGQGTQYGAGWERDRESSGSYGGRQNWGQDRSDYERDWRQGRSQGWEGRQESYGGEGMYGTPRGGRTSQTDRGWEGHRGYESQQFRGTGSMTGREGQWGGEGWNDSTGGWRGDTQRERGQTQGQFTGRGPRNYKRSDQRIEEDINEQLTRHPMIDASDIEVSVQNGEVTLRGNVDHRDAKRTAEDIAEGISGVKDVNNQIKVKQRGETETGKQHETDATGRQRERKAS